MGPNVVLGVGDCVSEELSYILLSNFGAVLLLCNCLGLFNPSIQGRAVDVIPRLTGNPTKALQQGNPNLRTSLFFRCRGSLRGISLRGRPKHVCNDPHEESWALCQVAI